MNIFKQLSDSTNYFGRGDNFIVKSPIGYNGHLIYTTGQEGVPKVQFLNIPNKPKDVIQVIHYVPNKKLVGIVDDFGSPLGMQYEWDGGEWQKVANLGHDIELIKRKYGV